MGPSGHWDPHRPPPIFSMACWAPSFLLSLLCHLSSVKRHRLLLRAVLSSLTTVWQEVCPKITLSAQVTEGTTDCPNVECAHSGGQKASTDTTCPSIQTLPETERDPNTSFMKGTEETRPHWEKFYFMNCSFDLISFRGGHKQTCFIFVFWLCCGGIKTGLGNIWFNAHICSGTIIIAFWIILHNILSGTFIIFIPNNNHKNKIYDEQHFIIHIPFSSHQNFKACVVVFLNKPHFWGWSKTSWSLGKIVT